MLLEAGPRFLTISCLLYWGRCAELNAASREGEREKKRINAAANIVQVVGEGRESGRSSCPQGETTRVAAKRARGIGGSISCPPRSWGERPKISEGSGQLAYVRPGAASNLKFLQRTPSLSWDAILPPDKTFYRFGCVDLFSTRFSFLSSAATYSKTKDQASFFVCFLEFL